jgi:hypothetical protein
MLSRSAVAIAGAGLLGPSSALARQTADPRPIPGGFDENFNIVPTGAFFHALLPGIGFEMSTITDFNGVLGGSEIRGTAQGSDGSSYGFDTDMRFMRGVYVGLDKRIYQGAFAFI